MPRTVFSHDLAALMLFERLAEEDDRSRRLPLPADIGGANEAPQRPLELVGGLAQRVAALAERFDRRNGNTSYREWIDDMRRFSRADR